MKLIEVLKADWSVDNINVTVRDKETSKYIMQYRIGADARPDMYERFVSENSQCVVYEGQIGMQAVVMRRIIQNYQLDDLPPNRQGLHGVVEKAIPKAIRELEVSHMMPYSYGRGDSLHGYMFDCYVAKWSGIEEEHEQVGMPI